MARRSIFSFRHPALVVLLPILVAACGGGGNSEPPNVAPTVSALADETLTVGDEIDVAVSITDGNAGDTHTLAATSSDTGVASVAVNGASLSVTALAAGTAMIMVSARDNSGAANAQSQSVSFTVTVAARNARPVVDAIADQNLKAGASVDIEITVTDADAHDTHSLAATASDEAVVGIVLSDGVLTLTGKAQGAATVTVTAEDDSGTDNAASEPVTFEVQVAGGWVEGVFEPAGQFKNFCANPRMSDAVTGETFADRPGATVDENNWLRSWSNNTYLWYDEIVDRNPGLYSTPEYFGMLKTTATTPSGNPKDRFHFTYPTEVWEALINSGASVGYGMQVTLLSTRPPREAVVAFTEPGSPAAAGGLARGARILKIDGVDLVEGSDVDTLNAGLFPAEEGETHEFEVLDLGETEPRTVELAAQVVESDPVQHVTVLETDSGPVGYMLFNDFIRTAERELVNAFEALSSAGITDLVLDLRYNGGGYLDIASQLGYMIAGPAAAGGRVFEELQFNDKHRTVDPVTGRQLLPLLFHDTTVGFSLSSGDPLPSVNLSRVFVLAGPGTCSASEAVVNGLRGIDVGVVLIGDTTCGKPYGFYATGNCGTTYFTVQFRGVNAKGFGDYADGFSPANIDGIEGIEVPGCVVADDFDHGFANPEEARLQAALHYRADGTCPLSMAGAGERKPGITRKAAAFGSLLEQNYGLKIMTRER